MFEYIKEIFIELLSACTIGSFGESLASNSDGRLKCISLSNRQCQTRRTLNDINSNETLFYPFYSVLTNVVEFVALLMIHILEYVFQIK